VIVGLPALRIRGLYLALVTLALAVLFPQIIKRFSEVTGGTQGKQVGRFREADWSGLAFDQWLYYIFLGVALLCWLLTRNLIRSRTGRALIAVRDNEIAAEVLGVNLAFYKVMTFGLSAMLAGIGGSLYVYQFGFVDARSFDIRLSIEILVAVVVGGVATISGPAIGAFFVEFVPEWTQGGNEQLSPVIFGALLIVMMMVMPGGIVGLARQGQAWVRRQVLSRRAPPDEAPAARSGDPPTRDDETAPVP
jgi:branched-chain amino acid transport system permease protein